MQDAAKNTWDSAKEKLTQDQKRDFDLNKGSGSGSGIGSDKKAWDQYYWSENKKDMNQDSMTQKMGEKISEKASDFA